MEPVRHLSLLDTEGCDPANFVLVYKRASDEAAFWTKWLDARFAHVELWRPLGDDLYLTLEPYHDYLVTRVVEGLPDAQVYQRVTARRRRGMPLVPFGLKTCVSVVKAALGLRAAWIITPKQLFNHIEKRRGIV